MKSTFRSKEGRRLLDQVPNEHNARTACSTGTCNGNVFRSSKFHPRIASRSDGCHDMTSKANPGRSENGGLGPLRAAALIGVLAGAVGSVGLTLHAGRHNNSRLLMVLFALWVLSPFMALVMATVVSKRWSVHTRATLYSVMLVLTLGSLAVYGDVALGPPRAKTAFVFVIVPPASWLLMGIIVPIPALISDRRSRRR